MTDGAIRLVDLLPGHRAARGGPGHGGRRRAPTQVELHARGEDRIDPVAAVAAAQEGDPVAVAVEIPGADLLEVFAGEDVLRLHQAAGVDALDEEPLEAVEQRHVAIGEYHLPQRRERRRHVDRRVDDLVDAGLVAVEPGGRVPELAVPGAAGLPRGR